MDNRLVMGFWNLGFEVPVQVQKSEFQLQLAIQ